MEEHRVDLLIRELRKSEREVRCIQESGRALSRARHRTFSEVRAGMSQRNVAQHFFSPMLYKGSKKVVLVHVNSGRPHRCTPLTGD